MWSRKPTPVAALASPAVEIERQLDLGLGGARAPLLAVRGSSVLIIADSPWTGKPSARAIASTCGASFAAAAAGISTVEIRRRKAPGPSGPEKRPAPPVGSTWLEPAT